MKTYFADIIPKIQRFSRKLDDLTKLTNQHWVSLGDIDSVKRVFIFRGNNQLIISENGLAEKGSWEYLGNQSILLETKQESYLLKHGFFDENIIALKLDSTNAYAFFVNETKFEKELNRIEDVLQFLEAKYLNQKSPIDGLGNSQQSLNEEYSYEILSEKNSYDLVFGSHTLYTIKYMNGHIDVGYKGGSSNKYFYLDFMYGKIYCSDFEDLVYKLFSARGVKK